MKKTITLGSLFDGIGGFPFCAELSGITPVWAAEIEPACVAVTKRHFPNMLHFGDVTKINGAEIPPVDIITFGSPCQDLSVAGKRKGLKHTENGDDETTRSGLFVEAIRIIYEMRSATHGKYPAFIVWENVPGAFSSHKGRDFQTVLSEITKTDIPMPGSGKWAKAGVVRGSGICAAWRLLDAQYWGVPQRRKRIYLIGSFERNCAEEILFKRDRVQRYLTPSGTQGQGVAVDSQSGIGGGNFENCCGVIQQNTLVFDAAQVTSKVNGSNPQWNAPCHTLGKENADRATVIVHSAGFCDKASAMARSIGYEAEKSTTLRAEQTPSVVYAIDRAAFNQGENAKYDFEISDSGINSTLVAKGPSAVAYGVDCRNVKINEELNGTLQAHTDGGFSLNTNNTTIYKFIEWVIRRLTPLECERLQGYHDGWTKIPKIETMSDSNYELFKTVFLLDKQIRGKKVKAVPNRKQLLKWYNKLECDSTRYKQLGNSLAIPCALRVISGIAEYIREENA